MAISLTLTPFSNSIMATVNGLDSVSYDRFVWYLDGKEFATETVKSGENSHGFVLAPVYFASPHTVGVEIYHANERIFSGAEQTSTLYAEIPLWEWSESNGQATDAQTIAAHEAAVSKGLVSNYSHLVWDDFVRLLKDALDSVGLPWLTAYSSYENALVGETYGALTAKRFNSVVQNIRYPYWTWESQPGSYGYIGRQAVRSGDTVYGLYMLELAKYLNVVLGIYNGTAATRAATASVDTVAIHSAIARARKSAPIRHTSSVGGIRESAGLVYLPREKLHGETSVAQLAVATLHILRRVSLLSGVSVSARTSSELNVRTPAPVTSHFSVNHSVVGSVNAVRPIMTSGASRDDVSVGGELENSRPRYANGESGIITFGSGGIEQKPPERVCGIASNMIDFAAAVKMLNAVHLTGATDVSIGASGTIGVESTWEYPEQVGDELIVYQTISRYRRDASLMFFPWDKPDVDGEYLTLKQSNISWQTEDRLKIDWAFVSEMSIADEMRLESECEIDQTQFAYASATDNLRLIDSASAGLDITWLDPVQEDDELTIRQGLDCHVKDDSLMFFPWDDPIQSDDELTISQGLGCYAKDNDLMFFSWSEPVRDGGELTIRQVLGCYVRAGNLMCFDWLDSAQDGNNIIIRQGVGYYAKDNGLMLFSWSDPTQEGDELTLIQANEVLLQNAEIGVK